jgi:(p)ppGpp synthase/HD superfamily hydrolase
MWNMSICTVRPHDIRRISEAAVFAAHAHRNQIREEIGDAYLVHLSEVAALCASIKPLDPVLVAAAWLHDTLEYTETDAATLRRIFGQATADLVQDVSDPPRLKSKARRQRQVDHTAKAGVPTKRLKLADRTSNVEEVLNAPADRLRIKSGARYLKWSRRVVEVCRGVAPELEARFDRYASRLQARLNAAKGGDSG